jgi:hypothetical protein
MIKNNNSSWLEKKLLIIVSAGGWVIDESVGAERALEVWT